MKMISQSFMSLRSSYLLYSRKKRHGCQCHRIAVKNCQADQRQAQKDNLNRDIDDIADSVMEIMCICGMQIWIVKKTREAIKRAFYHYDDIRYRIDRVPRKRLPKESFIYDLAKEAGMSRIDGQLAYTIAKRAFKAYYHGTTLEGKRLRSISENMKHRQECLWLHAAKRTAEIYAAYKGLMYSEQQIYRERFECVYKCLFEVLHSREIWDDDIQCHCILKSMANSIGDKSMDTDFGSAAEVEVLFRKQSVNGSFPSSIISIRMERISKIGDNDSETPKLDPDLQLETSAIKHSASGVQVVEESYSSKHTILPKSSHSTSLSNPSNLSRETLSSRAEVVKCLCPQLYCDREFTREPPVITAECSQGPYICRWLPYDRDEEEFKEHRVPFPPIEVICPTCRSDDVPCDKECTCTCEFCQCKPAYDEGGEEEHVGERLSDTGLEDYDTDYCWLAPFRDWPRVDRLQEEEEEEEAEAIEEDALFQCKCDCEIKRHAFPHLFTYLAPFRPQKHEQIVEPKEDEVPEAAEEEEDLLNKRPPRGISVETYRCWNLPAPSDSSGNSKDDPLILVLPFGQKHPQSNDINIEVTVKKQHYQLNDPPVHQQQPVTNGKSSIKSNLPHKTNGSKAPSPSGSPKRRSKEANAKSSTARPPPNSPNIEPNNTNRNSTLNREDILNIIGLGQSKD